MTDTPRAHAPRSHRFLLAAAVALLLVEPGRVPLFEPDEGRYSEIPREMLATGDWVVPRLNGVLYFEKPPLFYWSVALSFRLFGESELAARVPTKLATVGMVALALLFARKRWGERVGVLAGLILATSILAVAMARITIIDPALSFALSAAAFAFAAFQEAEGAGDARRARRALYGLHVACAAAVLLKGLIGLVLPGGAILVWALVTGRWRAVARLFSPLPVALFLALTVPWHVLVAKRQADWFDFYVVHEHFERYFKREHRREGHPLYFVAVLLGGFLPWTPFFARLRECWPGATRAAWRSRATEAYLLVFSILVFLFFSASKSKLIPYLLPIWPAVAVLLALGIERAREKGATFLVERRLLALVFGAFFAAALVAGLGTRLPGEFGIGGAAVLLAAGAAAGFLLHAGGRRSTPGGEVAVSVALPWLVFLAGAVAALPGVARAITPWPIVERLLAERLAGERIFFSGQYVQAVPFYAKETAPIVGLGWSELDFGRARENGPSAFPPFEDFVRAWTGTERVFAVVHRDRLVDWVRPGLRAAPLHVLARMRNGKNYLVSNRPARLDRGVRPIGSVFDRLEDAGAGQLRKEP